MVKHNNVIPNAHFKKHWQERIRVTLDQPVRKKRRRLARKAKAAAIAKYPEPNLAELEKQAPKKHRWDEWDM